MLVFFYQFAGYNISAYYAASIIKDAELEVMKGNTRYRIYQDRITQPRLLSLF